MVAIIKPRTDAMTAPASNSKNNIDLFREEANAIVTERQRRSTPEKELAEREIRLLKERIIFASDPIFDDIENAKILLHLKYFVRGVMTTLIPTPATEFAYFIYVTRRLDEPQNYEHFLRYTDKVKDRTSIVAHERNLLHGYSNTLNLSSSSRR